MAHTLSIGILSAPTIEVTLHGSWTDSSGRTYSDQTLVVAHPLHFVPTSDGATFTLHNVTIGIHFHWQKKEDQTFQGQLHIISEGSLLTAVNIIDIEDYLVSVISSEMSPTAHLEFLKAHAVISRSWAMKQQQHSVAPSPLPASNIDSLITWQDHNDHTLYDICADDHCQRYQGLHRISHPNAALAVSQTAHQVLTYNGSICDCRFSKCCGGQTELFSTCWQDEDPPYLVSKPDADPQNPTDIFCANPSPQVLRQVLNSYDQSTTNFYRWAVHYTQEELSHLLLSKLQRNFGSILSLTPLTIGPSGRIKTLRIEGSLQSLTIGKELTIRSALSATHLYSSAFSITTHTSPTSTIPTAFTLHGRGWGHGVGLCQIGAAVMATKGYNYKEILQHYYPNTTIHTLQ